MAFSRRSHDQSPFGGEAVGKNPTDRAKCGTKRSLLVDGRGVPISLVVDGANRHDMKMLRQTLEAIQAPRPDKAEQAEQHLCLDKGYDYPEIHELVAQWGWTAHIRGRGEEMSEKKRIPGYRSRRYVVERSHSWINRFRRLLVRWEKKEANYLAMLHIACAFITSRHYGVLG